MLNNLSKITTRNPKRVGRGYGSGKGGHTVGKGQKGQKSRAGFNRKPGFEGGQLPLYRRLPQIRGWGNKPVTDTAELSLSILEKNFKEGEKVTPEALLKKNLVPRDAVRSPRLRIKILANGKLTKKLEFSDKLLFSASAKKQVS